MCWSIVGKTEDEKTKLQALALINDVNKYRIDLATNGIIVNDALRIVQSKMEHLSNEEKRLLKEVRGDAEAAEAAEAEDTGEVNSSPGLEEQQTHNGIF